MICFLRLVTWKRSVCSDFGVKLFTRTLSDVLILASGSPRRAEILSGAGFQLDVVPSGVDEKKLFSTDMDLSCATEHLAFSKAKSVSDIRSNRYVLGADTIVVLGHRVLGKPESAVEATAMLKALSDRNHEVITGVAVIDPMGNSRTTSVRTSVTIRGLENDEIAKYVASESPYDKAGGYGIQDRSFSPVTSYDDCYLNVVGLPMCATLELLQESELLRSDMLPRNICHGHKNLRASETVAGE